MKKLMLFFVLIVLAGCAKPLETTTVDTNAIYDGFAEASRHHTMPYKDLDRSKPYHYFHYPYRFYRSDEFIYPARKCCE